MPEIDYVQDMMESEELLEKLCPPVRNWFKDKFPDFTHPQKVAIPKIMEGEHLLLCSPTGSGKTLTEFSKLPSNERLTKSLITDKNAVSVLKEHVCEHRIKCSPSIIFGMATF